MLIRFIANEHYFIAIICASKEMTFETALLKTSLSSDRNIWELYCLEKKTF
ncbi:hypothetical protein ATK78_2386 [Pedobacter metabolipauper]|uniref:Uncharacterized protein n=1 Tax=Pedobacter metabolipauper TaxID=425513 RepID=A0A4R6SXL8_9SPHI|nr:hypothetical protein ATK78_2386 [Pedobacter metabolipauper]